MAVFISLETEPFEDNMRQMAQGKPGSGGSISRSARAGMTTARRPLRGIEIKTDTYGFIQIIRSDGTIVPLVDQGTTGGTGDSTSSFLLQSVQEARMEKHQIIETFGEPYIFFFGESPRFLDCQAILVNTNDFNWEAEWWDNWDNRVRGTKTVEQGARTYLFYDDTIVEGYMLMASAVKTSDQPWTVQLTWRMFVTSYRNVSFVGDPNFPVAAEIYIPPNIDLVSADAFDQLTTQYQDESRGEQARALQDQNINDAARQAGTPVPNSFGVSLGPGGFTTGPAQLATPPNSIGGIRKLSDLIRTGIRSTAFAPEVGQLIATLSDQDPATRQALEVFNTLSTRPLRGKIVDNTDEWTGNSPAYDYTPADGLPDVYQPTWRSVQESQNIFLDAIRWMICFGANINNYSSLNDLGFRVSVRAGSSINSGFTGPVAPTYGPVAMPGLTVPGYPATSMNPAALAAGYPLGFPQQLQNGNPFFAQQPQGTDLFFGTSAASAPGLDGVSSGYAYGYTSPFGGPGYGASGFGDQPGLGYGSSFGPTGDPGMIDPGKFTFAGVADEQSSFQRFIQPTPPLGAGIGGIGLGVSGSIGVGASISVGGSPSAFGMGAYPGTLDPFGTCSQTGNLQQFGTSGVGLGVGLSAGAVAAVRI